MSEEDNLISYILKHFTNETDKVIDKHTSALKVRLSKLGVRRGQLTDEWRRNISIAGKNKKHSSEHVINQANSNRGSVRSVEIIKQISLYKKGKKLNLNSESEIKRKINVMKANRKQVSVNGVVYDSITDASILLGYDRHTITSRLKDTRFPEWFYLNPKEKNYSEEHRKISINGTIYSSLKEAADAVGLSTKTVNRLLLSTEIIYSEWKYLEKECK